MVKKILSFKFLFDLHYYTEIGHQNRLFLKYGDWTTDQKVLLKAQCLFPKFNSQARNLAAISAKKEHSSLKKLIQVCDKKTGFEN